MGQLKDVIIAKPLLKVRGGAVCEMDIAKTKNGEWGIGIGKLKM